MGRQRKHRLDQTFVHVREQSGRSQFISLASKPDIYFLQFDGSGWPIAAFALRARIERLKQFRGGSYAHIPSTNFAQKVLQRGPLSSKDYPHEEC